ncbi:VCBS repeat-containing protein [bacterium]|nr:VCBS repeat-containing protein [bacterium]
MVDVDDDGDMDLLIGDDEGYVKLYIREDNGDLSFAERLQADDEDIDVEDRAMPEWTDWDLDGDYDLLIGSSMGTIELFINTGSAEEHEFTSAGLISAGDEEIWLGTETAPVFGDLDGDDKRDLVIGSVFGELWFAPNIGEDDEPEFGEMQQLQDEEGSIQLDLYSRPELVDWNGDGNLDILSGRGDPEVILFINAADDLPHITVNPEQLNFGEINLGVRRSLDLTIGNEGDRYLTISDISVDGEYFRAQFQEEFIIDPDETHDVTVIFAPETEGNFEASLTITSDDPENGELVVTLLGRGLPDHVGENPVDTTPDRFYLSEAYPNPFNSVTGIRYGLPYKSMVSMTVYDITGKTVSLLFSGEREAGRYEASWDASGFRTGVYFLRMETSDDKYVRKIVLVK